MRSPVGRAHLLAHDHRQRRPGASVARTQRAVDAVVVGDREVGQARAAAAVATTRSDGLRANRTTPSVWQWRSTNAADRAACGSTRSDALDERLLEEVEVLERETRAERDAVERVLGDVARDAGDLGQQLVDVAQQRRRRRT